MSLGPVQQDILDLITLRPGITAVQVYEQSGLCDSLVQAGQILHTLVRDLHIKHDGNRRYYPFDFVIPVTQEQPSSPLKEVTPPMPTNQPDTQIRGKKARAVLDAIPKKSDISAESLAQKTGIGVAAVQVHICNLKKEGLVTSALVNGRARYTRNPHGSPPAHPSCRTSKQAVKTNGPAKDKPLSKPDTRPGHKSWDAALMERQLQDVAAAARKDLDAYIELVCDEHLLKYYRTRLVDAEAMLDKFRQDRP